VGAFEFVQSTVKRSESVFWVAGRVAKVGGYPAGSKRVGKTPALGSWQNQSLDLLFTR
jgi:hypothetical protein